jgi:hypothetical protein
MIRKFLVISKAIYLTSSRVDIAGVEDQVTIELILPLEIYWQAKDILKQTEFLTATTDDTPKVQEAQIEVLKLVVPFVISEKERVELYERIKTKSGIA